MEYTGINKGLEKMEPMISVCVLAYQHAPFIAQCLDGVLMQETNFSYEVILGDDESTDGTREICIEYANKHSDKIKLFLRSRKDVIYVNGKPTGRFNLIQGINSARGKYLALIDGDDFWIDPFKLQKQFDFLESNPEYVLCGTHYKILDSSGNLRDFRSRLDKITLIDNFKSNYFATCTVMFRAKEFRENRMLDTLLQVNRLDWVLWCGLLEFGLGTNLDFCGAVYNHHGQGVSSSQTMSRAFRGRILDRIILIRKYNGAYKNQIKSRVYKIALSYLKEIILFKFRYIKPLADNMGLLLKLAWL